uniref:Gem-associated protein 2 n=1 Tax=Schistocephalus solidus TaxID=70667 RepID=A0A0V0J306_SCHSO
MPRSSESSSDELLQQALPVDDTDGLGPPNVSAALLSANDYLRHVRYESSQYPKVMVSDKHLKGNFKLPTATEDTTQKSSSYVSEEWQRLQADLFRSAKREFDVLKANMKLASSPIIPLPSELELTDLKAWFSHNSPKISHFISLSQKTIIEVLQTLLPLCTPKYWNSSLEPWIYSTLIALEQPLHPDTCHSVRRLAKSFRKIASKSEEITSKDISRRWPFCEIIIAIVAFVFGQLDLVT